MGNPWMSAAVLCLLVTLHLGDFIHIATPPNISHLRNVCPKYSVLSTNGVDVACYWCAVYCSHGNSTDCWTLCSDYMVDYGNEPQINGSTTVISPTAINTTTQPNYRETEPQIVYIGNSEFSVSMSGFILTALVFLILGVALDRIFLLVSPKIKPLFNRRAARSDPEDGTSSELLEVSSVGGPPTDDTAEPDDPDANPDGVVPTAPTPPASLPGNPGGEKDDSFADNEEIKVETRGDTEPEPEDKDLFTLDSRRPGPVTGGDMPLRHPAENDEGSNLNVQHRGGLAPGTSMSVSPSSTASQVLPHSQRRQ